MSQAGMEDDCLRRLKSIAPRDAQVKAVGFSALGSNAAYWVVSYRFSHDLDNGKRQAVCTYRRNGDWVMDDAAAFKLSRDLARPGPSR